jgi:hypothetical protein
LISQWGLARLQAVVSGGQYEHPEGLFFGGHNPTWSHQALRHVLHDHGSRCARLAWVDLHSGLGPRGHGERILACAEDHATVARARAWWGRELTSLQAGTSTSSPLTGLMWVAAPQECPQAEYTGIALEFGTVPVMEVIEAMRAEQWVENHPEAPAALQREAKQRLRDVFYVDSEDWKSSVLEQSLDAAQQAVRGLAA